jgi:uncharacterized protein DUF1553/uncharacterized protein DUF1549/cytochrome c
MTGQHRRTTWSIVAVLVCLVFLVLAKWSLRHEGMFHLPWAAARPEVTAPPNADALFTAKILPVLDDSCFKCHGGDKVGGGLRLDTRTALLKGGKHGAAVIPGDAGKSLLVQALRYEHDEVAMPPDGQLDDAVIADFAKWVDDGAVWPDRLVVGASFVRPTKLWSLQPTQLLVPPIEPHLRSVNVIDRIVWAKLRRYGLSPADPADKGSLLRRATFDLTGLPPTPAEVDAFLTDQSTDAFAKVVDRLLASPAYGERWGRHWLDVVRYADSGGFEADHYYPSAWRFRDYVIRSLNADKPIDRFIQEHVAGDELWPDDADAAVGTAMYCVGPALAESAMVSDQLEYEWLTDAVDTTGAAFLGLTFGCARCHDHKYDPITQKDYYALQAVFAASDRPYPEKVRLLRIKALNGLLSETPVPKDKLNDPRCAVKTEGTGGFRLFHRDDPLAVHLLRRGELSKPREVVQPDIPDVLHTAEPALNFANVPASKRRAALAQWLTSPANPLTARVLVNRVWGWHFGQALVRTPNDFGNQGEPPTQIELLDWMARDFAQFGWNLKRLHRQIMLSSVYRMSSVAAGKGLEVDPEDKLLWHFPRRRLEGEAIRDAILACAGTLNVKAGGPPVVPPLSGSELTGLFDAKDKWPVTADTAEHTRRSVYLLQRRTFTYPLFAAFDPPEPMTSCPQRARTVVPAQALTLLNSPLARQQAAEFAKRLIKECGNKQLDVVVRAWQLAYGREPSPSECDRATEFLSNRNDGGADVGLEALADLCLVLFNSNEFVYVD